MKTGILPDMGGCPFTSINYKSHGQGGDLARSNYSFKKRQKELLRKKKQEEKRQRKLEKGDTPEEEITDQTQDEGERP